MDKLIYGADTETLNGKPMTLQFYSEDIACNEIHFVNERTACDVFLKWCAGRARDVQHVVYIHNLSFDLIELLWGHHHKLVSEGGNFEFKIGKFRVAGVYGTPTFCTVTNGHGVSIMIVDSFSYFRGSLAKGAELFCPDLPKLKRPGDIGEKRFTRKDVDFCEYAMRDAEVAYHMGRAIEAMHVEWDIRQCVSVADMAAQIFKRKFLSYTIPQPPRDVIDAALLSYHGGKNNVTVERGWYSGVSSLDISSAYPHAMREMPAFSDDQLYRRYRHAGSKLLEVPTLGVYRVTGRLADCQWPVLFSHGFKPLSGFVESVYVQGYELNEALRSGEFKPTRIVGTYYDAEKDHQAPALRGFVDTFYALKSKEKDPVLRFMQKLVLNSISGKFIQTRKRGNCAFTDISSGATSTASDLVAGGMFHPFIASAITAHTRARIHGLEHEYKAIHTATDGIMTQQRSIKGKGVGLGALTVEATDSTLLLIRNKCYVLYSKKSDKTLSSRSFKGKHIAKYALHGFQGTVHDLERLVATGKRGYEVNKPHRLKEALKRGLTPNQFAKRWYTLKVGSIKPR